MGNCYSINHIVEDYIHMNITCNIEEPQQKYHLETVSNRLLGGLNMFYWTQTSPNASYIDQSNQTITTHSTKQHKTFNIYFTYFLFLLIKRKWKQCGQL